MYKVVCSIEVYNGAQLVDSRTVDIQGPADVLKVLPFAQIVQELWNALRHALGID